MSVAGPLHLLVVFVAFSNLTLADSSFCCPDDRALTVLAIARGVHPPNGSFSDPVAAYTHVIQNASRRMDAAALHTACFRLAREAYAQSHQEGRKSLNIGLFPPKSAVQNLLKLYPILAHCPAGSLYEVPLPIARPIYTPPRQAVELGLTGWVDLKLTISDSGKVQSASIINSSDKILETGVIDHVLKFRDPSSSHYLGRLIQRDKFVLRIGTNYFHIAKAKGCEWEEPSWSGAF
jgi:Gram-negative bacterial TonB protein C-terminal